MREEAKPGRGACRPRLLSVLCARWERNGALPAAAAFPLSAGPRRLGALAAPPQQQVWLRDWCIVRKGAKSVHPFMALERLGFI